MDTSRTLDQHFEAAGRPAGRPGQLEVQSPERSVRLKPRVDVSHNAGRQFEQVALRSRNRVRCGDVTDPTDRTLSFAITAPGIESGAWDCSAGVMRFDAVDVVAEDDGVQSVAAGRIAPDDGDGGLGHRTGSVHSAKWFVHGDPRWFRRNGKAGAILLGVRSGKGLGGGAGTSDRRP